MCQIMKQKYLHNNFPLRVLSILDPIKGSTIWDFMMSSRDVVVEYVSWEVNNGVKDKFWRDSWKGAPLVIKSNLSQDLVTHSKRV